MLEDTKTVGLIDEDCLAFGKEVIVEDNRVVVRVRDEDCLMLDEVVIVEDNKVEVKVRDEDCLMLNEVVIVEDNKVVGVRVVLLKMAAETAQEYVSAGFHHLFCPISNLYINNFISERVKHTCHATGYIPKKKHRKRSVSSPSHNEGISRVE